MRRDGHIQDFESRIYRHDGSAIWISENARAVHDELAGELLYYEGMVQDITRRKSAEEARKQPKKALFATQRSCALRMRSSKQTSEWRVTFNRCSHPNVSELSGWRDAGGELPQFLPLLSACAEGWRRFLMCAFAFR
jgi:PAS domain-containing protein